MTLAAAAIAAVLAAAPATAETRWLAIRPPGTLREVAMRACPECGAVADRGMYFRVFQCSDCARLYCPLCTGSNGGRRCPDCQCSRYEVYGRVE